MLSTGLAIDLGAAGVVPGSPSAGTGLGGRTCAVVGAGHCRLTGGSACAGGASVVRASCWLASEGEARRLPLDPPPPDGEDLEACDAC
jgi:hypothetical protein